jgi:type II secretory pathway component PulF
MKFFIIYGIDENGGRVLDGFESESLESLHKVLSANNYIPIKVYQVPKFLNFLSSVFTPTASKDDIIELLDNLNIILSSGIPISEGLKDLHEDTEKRNVKKILKRIANEVNAGNKLSSACKPFQKIFTPTIVNLMAIGEETGQLTNTLKNGANFLRKTQSLQSNTKKALFTPVISLVLIIFAVAAWMAFVVPGMVSFFEDMDTELPPLTVFLIDASAFITSYGEFIAISFVAFIILVNISYKKISPFRFVVLKVALKLPLFKKLISFFNIAFISEYLHLGIHSGLTLYDSLKLLRQSIANDVYKKELERAIGELEKGESFSSTTRNNPLYTNFTTRVLEIGETTGELEKELDIISSTYYKKVDDISSMIPKIIQPLTLIIGGGFMALIMLGLMGPIYDLIATL